jgi:hypothetical protein
MTTTSISQQKNLFSRGNEWSKKISINEMTKISGDGFGLA